MLLLIRKSIRKRLQVQLMELGDVLIQCIMRYLSVYNFLIYVFSVLNEENMKIINNIMTIGLLSLVAMVTSCDSVLDKGPLDKFTNKNFLD